MSDNKKYEFYQYNPSKAAAVIFIILFVCTTALHSYQMLRTRTWFLVPLVLGGFCESPEPAERLRLIERLQLNGLAMSDEPNQRAKPLTGPLDPLFCRRF